MVEYPNTQLAKTTKGTRPLFQYSRQAPSYNITELPVSAQQFVRSSKSFRGGRGHQYLVAAAPKNTAGHFANLRVIVHEENCLVPTRGPAFRLLPEAPETAMRFVFTTRAAPWEASEAITSNLQIPLLRKPFGMNELEAPLSQLRQTALVLRTRERSEREAESVLSQLDPSLCAVENPHEVD